ncbi:MAG: SH3 domain-containing protein [Eubacteriales bacterium]|nr:SH3 domain-containing protein [Eubacteriales bacterium]
MKRISFFLAITLCLCLIFQAAFVQAAGIKLKIGVSSGNSEEKTEETSETKEDNQDIEESVNTSKDKSDISDSKKQEDNQSKTPKTESKQSNIQRSGSAEQSMSNEEFLLSCDYKLITATNARILYEDNYSFAFLEQGTYLRYLRNTDDTLEAEVYLDNTIKTAWVPTHNVVLAATIIKDSDGETVIVNEKDPERDTKIKSGKVLLKEGDNPLINKARIKNVNTLLFDSQNYNYSGLSLEENNTDKNNNKKARIAGKPDKNQKITLPIGKTTNAKDDDGSLDDEDESTTKLSIPSDEESDTNSEIDSDDGTMKLSIGSSNKIKDVDNSESNEKTSLNVDNGTSMNALATATEDSKLYSNNVTDSETVANINSGEEIEVYDLGYAFSKVIYNGMEGYMPTSSIKFEDGNDFAVVIDKKGNANTYKDDSLKEKVSKIPIGTVVQVIEESGKTLKVNYKGNSVFVPFDSMQFISRPTSLDRIGTIKSQNENAKINTRINDSKGAAIVEKIPVGEHVTIIKSDEKWFHIATPSGKYAYVQSQFIKEN